MTELLTIREFGPVSPQALRVDRSLRRFWHPMASHWRLTRRGINAMQRLLEPRGRIPVVRGTKVEPTTIGEIPGVCRSRFASVEAPAG